MFGSRRKERKRVRKKGRSGNRSTKCRIHTLQSYALDNNLFLRDLAVAWNKVMIADRWVGTHFMFI